MGLEKLQHNGLEHFVTNLGHEKMVRYLLESRIRDEERLYEAEGIAFEPIYYPDNAGVIALMEAPPDGIIPTLFSHLEASKPSETKFLASVKGINSACLTPKLKKRPKDFGVTHFTADPSLTGSVLSDTVIPYDITGWLDKAKSLAKGKLLRFLGASTDSFVRRLVNDPESMDGGGLDAEEEDGGVVRGAAPSITNITPRRTLSETAGMLPGGSEGSAEPDEEPLRRECDAPTSISEAHLELTNLLRDLKDAAHFSHVLCMRANTQVSGGSFDSKAVLQQLQSSRLPALVRSQWQTHRHKMSYVSLSLSSGSRATRQPSTVNRQPSTVVRDHRPLPASCHLPSRRAPNSNWCSRPLRALLTCQR